MSGKNIIFISLLIIAAGVGAFIFYGLKRTPAQTKPVSNDNSFIESVAQSPAVEGNIVNSGIAGVAVLTDGKPFTAMLDVFQSGDMSKPFISVIAKEDGTIQIPLQPGSYMIKPLDPDGPRAPTRESYAVNVGPGQWVRVRIEYR